MALCKKADSSNAGPVFLLLNEATGMAAELPEPSREKFADLIKALEQSTKMSAMNPATALYGFKSTYEKQIIAKHPDYQDGLKAAQKLTAPHRIRQFLKTAFNVKGVRQMLSRLHHNESRDAARAELALKLTEQYLLQFNTVNTEEIDDVHHFIHQELDQIWRDTTAPIPPKHEAEALGDNVPTPVITRRALYKKDLKATVSRVEEEKTEQLKDQSSFARPFANLRSKLSHPVVKTNSNPKPDMDPIDLDAYFANKQSKK